MRSPTDLLYRSGLLVEFLRSKETDIGYLLFAIFYTADSKYIERILADLSGRADLPNGWRQRVLLLLSAHYLTEHKYRSAIEAFNSINIDYYNETNDQFKGFFDSTLRFIETILVARAWEQPSNLSARKFFFIGDSHALGVTSFIKDNSVVYLPGLRLSYLASPQPNAIKVGFQNAINRAYSERYVLISIGEIDSREVYSKLINDSEWWKFSRQKWMVAISKAIKFIADLRHPLQDIFLIVPPPPSEFILHANLEGLSVDIDQRRALFKQVVQVNSEFRDIFTENAAAHDLCTICYTSVIAKKSEFVMAENLVDHAHFKQTIYQDLIYFWTSEYCKNYSI